MDNPASDSDKIIRIQASFDRYSNVMRDLRQKKLDTIVEYRKKIDAVKIVNLEKDLQKDYRYA